MDWAWLPPAAFGALSAGAGLLSYVLVSSLEPQPEYPTAMTTAMRVLGVAIGVLGVLFGARFLLAAAVAALG